MYAVRNAICNELGLSRNSPADVIISKTNQLEQSPEDILVIFEVKMSIVWNWEYIKDNSQAITLRCISNYKTHQGNPGLLRSDSMLKAIGKSTNIRALSLKSSKIPIVIIGNTPITSNYYNKVDYLKRIGFIQGFWSVNPNPAIDGEIIWNKASSASPSTAWGSWLSAANPVLRDIHEYILIFSKETFSRKQGNKSSTIKKEEFLEWTKSVWTFPAVSAKSIGHPAPFPEELPYRLIQLYTFKDEVVLDPFCGSGTTCLAAKKNKRHYIGYDINPDYVKLANNRINSYFEQQSIFNYK